VTGQLDNYISFFLLEVPIFRKKSDFCGCVCSKTEKGSSKTGNEVLKQEIQMIKDMMNN
jgi:predicted adenine nucleotide alpha hydrolase (AANH) superfamily ATPase